MYSRTTSSSLPTADTKDPHAPKCGQQNFAFAVNPAHLLKRQKESDGRVRFLNQHDREEARLRKIIAVRYPNKMPEFEISLRAGMRRSQQHARINWAGVNLQRRDLFVPESKSGQRCHIPLKAPALAAFQALREAIGCHGSTGIFQAEVRDERN
jgi:hypothetical protein